MALSTTFNRLKREIGIKRCLIIDGNVGDVYLNDKKQIVDLKQYLMDMLDGTKTPKHLLVSTRHRRKITLVFRANMRSAARSIT